MGLNRLRFLIIPFGVLLIGLNFKAIYDFWRAGDRITAGAEKLEGLKKENERLKKEIARTQTEQYLEEAARNKLGWAKMGEEIVIIPESLLKADQVATSEPVPNWKKWKNVFF